MDQFDEYVNKEELHDLEIIIDNGEENQNRRERFYAHKLILAFSSPYFKT